MPHFRLIVMVAALAGLVTGLVVTGAQLVAAIPLIQEAETFEATAAAAIAHHLDPESTVHVDGQPWHPRDGLERLAFTTLANIVIAIGFGLLLVAAGELRGGIKDWREGLLWGLGGFAAFTLAPSVSLPPELPAMPTAALAARQLWWITTVALTAVGLAALVFGRHPAVAGAGLLLILAPHLVGAPQPRESESPLPPELAREFFAAAILSGFLLWTVLGSVAGHLRSRAATT